MIHGGMQPFYIGKVQHVTIRGGRIEGDRHEHVYKPLPAERRTHEWGFGICIEGASHVEVNHVQKKIVRETASLSVPMVY
ncbi:hypothetical protein BsIDN1_07480 [Bacillus safensis]|uniref:Uncharacterized protein n=1 Tax=Bacillus safensis TaxID=561879 RepID=A0A5S9M0I7_BACIA|nr:hypothetical protein BsIDN1_07480 [Bacillus safensis]